MLWLLDMVRRIPQSDLRLVLTLHFADMHPLALEDLLHFRKNARSKADYYPKHLFLRVLCHTLCDDDEASTGISSLPSLTHLPRSASPAPMESDDEYSEASWGKEKQPEDEAAILEAIPSRFTSRSSTLRNTARRRMSRNSDVESRPASTPHFTLIDSKVCIVVHSLHHRR